MSSYLFSTNIPRVKHIWQGQIDCFLTKSNVTVISENVPVYWMSVLTRTCPSKVTHEKQRWKTKQTKKRQNWYWSIIKLTHGEFCETVFPVSTLETKDSLTSGTSWYSFPLKTWNRLIIVVLKQKSKKLQWLVKFILYSYIYKWQLFYYQIQKV